MCTSKWLVSNIVIYIATVALRCFAFGGRHSMSVGFLQMKRILLVLRQWVGLHTNHRKHCVSVVLLLNSYNV